MNELEDGEIEVEDGEISDNLVPRVPNQTFWRKPPLFKQPMTNEPRKPNLPSAGGSWQPIRINIATTKRTAQQNVDDTTSEPSKLQRLTLPPSTSPGEEAPVLFSADFASIAQQRLNAIKKAQEFPNDQKAKKMFQFANEQMRLWAQSRKMPLPDDLKEESSSKEVPKNNTSQSQISRNSPPRLPERIDHHRVDRRSSYDSLHRNNHNQPYRGAPFGAGRPFGSDSVRRNSAPSIPRTKTGHSIEEQIEGKHPVSALGEFCRHKRWGIPSFACAESGDKMSRRFLFTTTVHGVDYTPTKPATTKKLAKAQSCQVALLSLGAIKKEKLDELKTKV